MIENYNWRDMLQPDNLSLLRERGIGDMELDELYVYMLRRNRCPCKRCKDVLEKITRIIDGREERDG